MWVMHMGVVMQGGVMGQFMCLRVEVCGDKSGTGGLLMKRGWCGCAAGRKGGGAGGAGRCGCC